MDNDIIEVPIRQTAVITTTPADLLKHALDNGADLDRLEKLMALQHRWEADQARKAYAEDMARFKFKPLSIYKDKHVRFKTSTGVTEYDHATIGNVCEVIISALAEFGFSHRWQPTQADGQVIVECIITHRLGHSEITRLQASPDSSGGKNGIQSIMSAKTYLERHTLLSAVGMATKDQPDDDGAGAEPKEPETKALPVLPIDGVKRAIAAIKNGDCTVENMRSWHALTPEQDAVLAAVVMVQS